MSTNVVGSSAGMLATWAWYGSCPPGPACISPRGPSALAQGVHHERVGGCRAVGPDGDLVRRGTGGDLGGDLGVRPLLRQEPPGDLGDGQAADRDEDVPLEHDVQRELVPDQALPDRGG